ncbi:TonB-dependent receptor [Sphingobacterium alkalisoli]|uniref:TonB-dependent receptor n=1 Tax=Sphingobacterium alkalisoli TaxID=1874115 RepID=A0A4U0GX43_9SPHI|nr:TonB-dependent receptor [Sphingobacterium alkalisoli]TJY63576.1 TonB-dependent receptor [Sphingobacterium alkalisoli]GGH26944.1 membrane protein [Sphingobacterium alkalisoli]
MNKVALACLFVFVSVLLHAQQKNCNIQLSGQIVDKTGNKAIDGAIISISKNQGISKDKGIFSLKNLCLGYNKIRIEHISYQPLEMEIYLERDTSITFTLEIEHIHMEDIKIVGYKSTTLTSSTHSLTAQQLAESKGKVLADALAEIAGVTTLATGSNIVKPVINGLHSNRILLLNNGVRQEGQQWGVEHAPEIDPFMSDKIEVIKGAQGVRYGADALAGVVLTSPAPIDYEKVIGGRINLIGNSNGKGLSGHARLEGHANKLGWRISASSKIRGNTKTAGYYLGNTGAKELNYDGYIEYILSRGKFSAYASHFGTDLGIFSGAHIGTIEDIYARIENGKPFESYDFSYHINSPRQQVTHDLAKLNWSHQVNNGGELDLQYSFQRNHRQEFDLRRIESDDTPMADMVLTTQSFDAAYTHHESTVGINANLQVHNNTAGTGTTPIIPNFDNYTLGIFGIQQFHLANYHFEIGLRYDYRYFDVAGYRYDYKNPNANGSLNQYLLEDTKYFHNLSGTVGLLYHFLPNLNWKSNIGLAWRAPSANELYSDGVHHGSGTYEVGNVNLQSEKGLKWVNSLLYKDKAEKIDISLDVFGQYITDYIYANPNPDSVRQTIRGTFPLYAYRQDDVFFYGADLKLEYHITKAIDYGLSASIVKAINTDTKEYLPYIPSDRLAHYLQHQFKDAQALRSSYIKLNHRFVARQSRYEVNSDYTPPPAAYHLLDFTAGTQLHLKSNTIGIIFSIDNLTNKLYKDYMDRFRYYAHQLGRNYSIKLAYNF